MFRLPSPSDLGMDLRYALRAVRKDWRLFVFAVLIVGLGTGACTAIYSLLSPLMVRDLPFADSERLVWIANDGEGGMSAVTSRTSNLRDFRAESRAFEGITGYFAFFDYQTYNLVGDGEPERLVGVDVAQDFLDVLGVPVAHGRNFDDEEGVWGGRKAMILSHDFWVRRFAADPSVVGTALTLNGTPTEVVGVLPQSFDFAATFVPHTRVDFLLPFPISDETDLWGNTLSMIGRLAPGVSVEKAQGDLEAVIAGLSEADPDRWGLGAVVTGLQDRIASPFRAAGLLLAGAALVVMLIVCVNLSNLLLARGKRRAEEMAVRSALGAPRNRLIRQLLAESLVLSIAGSALGLVIAVAATRFVATNPALEVPLLRTAAVDTTTLLFAAGLSLVVTLLVGLLPALQVTRREASVFNEAGRGLSAGRGSTRLREGLVIAEVAMACILLVFGGLLLKSFQRVLDNDLGFRADELVRWQINPERRFETPEDSNAYYGELVRRVEAVPGVERVALTDAAPLGRNRTWGVGVPGVEYNGSSTVGAFPHLVDASYFGTMEIPLLRGRVFTADDTGDRETVAVLNQTAANVLFRGEEALGRTFLIGGEQEVRVVGVVEDVLHRSLEDGAGLQMYLPMTQVPDFRTVDLVVRSTLPASTLARDVQNAIRAYDPALPAREYQAFSAVVERSVSPRRLTLELLGSFAATALVLAILGIYGVLSFAVSERVREIGIRMALGETHGAVLARVIGKSLALAAVGLGIGVAGSIAVARWSASLLYQVRPTDPSTFALMAALLLGVSAVAGLVPAWRAARTDLATVLKAGG
ncbi:MAG: ABC transporter permease [Acidobacteriota bacterium]